MRYVRSSPPRAAAERDVQVVAQPGRQADVPAPPELLEVGAAVRRAEVLRQREAEHLRRADRDVGVRREVEVDLRTRRRRRRPATSSDENRSGRLEDAIDDRTSASVSAIAIFLNRPITIRNMPSAAPRARAAAARRAAAGAPAARTIGPATSCGKNSTKVANCTTERVARQLPAVDVDRVRQRLEGVERDARPAGSDRSGATSSRQHVVAEEVGVLEEREDAEVRAQAHDQRAPCAPADPRCARSTARGSSRARWCRAAAPSR